MQATQSQTVTTSALTHGLEFKDLEIQDFLYTTPGLSCDIALAQNIRTSQKFLLKIIVVGDKAQETILINELELWNKINLHPFKPKVLPKYFGYFKEENQQKTVYNVVYECLEVNMKKTIKAKLLKNELFDFEMIERSFTYLVNTLSFLQHLEIVPSRLDTDGLFHNNKEKMIKVLDISPDKDFLPALKRHPLRNLVYLPPEVLRGLSKESKKSEPEHETRKDASPPAEEHSSSSTNRTSINPYKATVFCLGVFVLEMLTLQTPKNPASLESDIMRLLNEANQRYSSHKNQPQIKYFLQLLTEILRLDPKERPDCRSLFWRNAELRNAPFMPSGHLMHHLFIEDGDCSELRLFDELRAKGKPFKLQEVQNPGDEIFGLGNKALEHDFSDKNGLRAQLSEVKPLRGVNIRTTKGNIDRDYRFCDDVILQKDFWDLENYPIRQVIFQANVHEKLVDDEYKKYYYNVFIKNAIKTNETCEEGAIKILHQHDWNFMEGVYDDQIEPVIPLLEDFVKGNKKLTKFVFLIQSFHRITEKAVLGLQKLIEGLRLEKLETLDFGFQLKSFKNQEILKEVFKVLDDKAANLGSTPVLNTFVFSVNTWDVQDTYLSGLSRFMFQLRNLKKLHLNLKEITKDNQSLQGSFPEALRTLLPDLTHFSLALRSEEKPYLDDDSLNKVVMTLANYTPKKLKSFSFFFDSGGVIERTIEILYEIIKDRTFSCVNFCYRGKYQVHDLKSSVVQKKFTQILQKNKPLIKIGGMQFLFCPVENKK